MKKRNFNFLLPTIASLTCLSSLGSIALTSCGGKGNSSDTYTVTYNTPTGLTWNTTVSNVEKGKSILMDFTLTSGYSINATESTIKIGGTNIINKITLTSSKLSIPASFITGNVVINIQLTKTQSYSVTYETTPTGLTWNSKPTTCTSGTDFEATYTLTNNYKVSSSSTIYSGATNISNNCSYANGEVIIPGSYITGNITITLITEEETSDVKYTEPEGGTITSKAGTYNTIYTFACTTSKNNSIMNVTLSGTWLNSSIKIASSGTYNITLADGFKLSNKEVTATSTSGYDADAPINITKNAQGAIVNFIIPDNAEATIYDKRSGTATNKSDIYVIRHNDSTATGQLNFIGDSTGGGVLNINSMTSNKGWSAAKAIQSKVNMNISGGVTINAFSYDTCIQCGGKLTIDNANVIADSYNDDAIKTKFLDPDEDLSLVSVNPNSNRDIIVKGLSTVIAYADKNGINAAHNFINEVDDNGTPTINVYTNKQASSVKSGSVAGTTTTTEQNMFIEVPSNLIGTYNYENYYWTINFYADNTSGTVASTEYMTLKKIASTSGGQGGSSSTNYFFKCDRPLSTDASYFKINLYAKAQYGQTTPVATATSEYITVSSPESTSTNDCLAISSISSSTINTSSTKFDRNYKATEKGESKETSIDTTVSSKGIKAKNNISLHTGAITIKSVDTCISCSYGDIFCNSATAGDVSFGAGTITISGATVNGYSASNDGLKAYGEFNISGGTLEITNAVEAVEAPVINISGGKTVLYATDDGLNASTAGKYQTSGLNFNMSGGILDVQTSSGDTDCIDSNNTITINGGLIVSRVPSSGSAMTLDWESGNVNVAGTATIVFLGKTEADGMNEKNPGPSSVSLTNGGTDYTSSSSASTICAMGNHTVTYYSTKTTSSTDTYTYNNKTAMNSSKVRIWSCTGKATIG